ncbi:MAG: rod shape-determining protein RodA [Gammaproteobacteria bacterium]|nr:rod shape-determining protein RodA [Gammaproteobacteria bacterium]
MKFSDPIDFYPNVNQRGRNSLLYRFHVDLPLLIGLLLISVTSLIILYSAGDQDFELIYRQGIRLGVAFIVMLVLAQIAPHHIQRWTPWLFAVGLILLFSVLVFGQSGKGAQRWLDLGFFRFQPSELMKLAVPMMIAWYLSDHALPPKLSRILISLLMVFVPVLLIARQPDLGTALLVGCAGIFVIFLAGIKWRLIFLFSGIIAACAPFLWFTLHDYQKARVLTFINPENDPLGAGYHIIQSKIAIGSGGVYGKGWLNGTQSQLDFLPERSTDFIFAAFAEEFGLVGVILLLAMYFFVILRGLYISAHAQDTFTRLLGGSLTMTFFIYVFVNIGMVTGLLPVVGLPLPLVSYGGTSMVTLMASFGMLMSIHTHRRLLST